MLYMVNKVTCIHSFHNALSFYHGWLVDAINMGLHLVLGVASACRCKPSIWYHMYHLLAFPYSLQKVRCWRVGGCLRLRVKETTCGGRALGACGVSAHSLKGVQAGSDIAKGSWQPARSTASLYFPLPWSFPQTVVYPGQGLKGAFWCFPSCNSASEREENYIQLGRRRNKNHVPGSDGERDVLSGLPYFLGSQWYALFRDALGICSFSSPDTVTQPCFLPRCTSPPCFLWGGSGTLQSMGMWNHILPSSCLRCLYLHIYYCL